MIKRKLNLDELKVESFVTSIESDRETSLQVNGGIESYGPLSFTHWTFMEADTGGCQISDIGGACTIRQTQTQLTTQTIHL